MKKPLPLKDIQKIYDKYKKFIWKEIPNQTKINWKIKEIKFKEDNKEYWSAFKDTIFIGNYYKSQSKIIASIIHESIHLNTLNKQIIGSKENFFAREIATCILTNLIVRKLNKRFNKRFKKNRFDEDYKKYEHKSNEFERKGKDMNFYEFFELIKKSIN